MPRPKALWLLGLALLRTLLKRFLNRPRGLSMFEANYVAEGLSPVSPEQRAAMGDFARCIACGRCNRGDAAIAIDAGGQFPGTMSLVLAATRNMVDFRAAARGFSRLTHQQLLAKQELCPVGVPFVELARFVLEQSDRARISQPGARGASKMPAAAFAVAAPVPEVPLASLRRSSRAPDSNAAQR
jgi:hypothetical protein